MGDMLAAAKGSQVSFEVFVTGSANGKVTLLEDGRALKTAAPVTLSSSSQTLHFSWTSDGQRHWFRPEVIGPDEKLWLLGNPIYVNWK
jgi:hypothetical protein